MFTDGNPTADIILSTGKDQINIQGFHLAGFNQRNLGCSAI